MSSKSNLYHISIPKWDEHNKSKKKNHRYFLIENRIFSDHRISQLTAYQFVLYMYLLTICADTNSHLIVFSTASIPQQLRTKGVSIPLLLSALEENQLLTIQKNDVLYNRIEKNTKEENRKEKKLPARQKSDELEKAENKKIKDAYFNAYRLRYGVEPVSNAAFNSQISNLRKKLGVDDSVGVVEFYLKHNDSFYLKNTHSFGLCLSNAETLRTQMLRGKPITSLDVRNFEKTQNAIQINESIKNGENF